MNNLKEYQKYQNGFVIFDAELNLEHIYLMCLTDRLDATCADNHQFFCMPCSSRQHFDRVNETVHFSAFILRTSGLTRLVDLWHLRDWWGRGKF